MNLRVSLILVILLSLTSMAVTWAMYHEGPERIGERIPFFYNLDSGDINRVELRTRSGATSTFRYNPDHNFWFFDNGDGPGGNFPVELTRWQGITTLLGGPRVQDTLRDTIDDPAIYGLDNPLVTITIGLRNSGDVRLLIGNETPDRDGHYAQIEGFPQLVRVSSAWGNVLTRLVNEPPLPRWLHTMDSTKVTEVAFLIDNKITRSVALDKNTGEWHLCSDPAQQAQPCRSDERADPDLIMPYLEVFGHPEFLRVERMGVTTDEAKAPYGVEVTAPYITVRWEEQLRPGVIEVDHFSMTFGDLTPDGEGMYVIGNETADVTVVDADWAREVMEFFDAPLAAQEG